MRKRAVDLTKPLKLLKTADDMNQFLHGDRLGTFDGSQDGANNGKQLSVLEEEKEIRERIL